MRRALVALLVIAIVVLGGVAAVRYLADRAVPERARAEIEALLSSALGVPVTVDEAHVVFGRRLRIQLEGLAARDESQERLRVARGDARFEWLALLFGSRTPDRIRLEGAELWITREEAGWRGFPGLVPEPRPEAEDPLLERVRDTVEGGVRWLLREPLPIARLEVTGARVHVSDRRPGFEAELRAEDVALHWSRQSLRRRDELRLTGALFAGDRAAGRVEVDAWRQGGRSGELRLDVLDLDLGLVLAQLPGRAAPPRRLGAASGSLSWKVESESHQEALLDLVISGVRLDPNSPHNLAGETFQLKAALDVTSKTIRVRQARIAGRGLEAALDGSLARPLSEDSATRLSLRLTEVPVRDVLDLASLLPEPTRSRVLTSTERVRAGRLVRFVASADAPLRSFASLAAGDVEPLIGRLRLDAVVEDGVFEVAGGEVLDSIAGRLAWSEDQLTIEGGRAHFRDAPLPTIDLSVSGLAAFAARDESLCESLPAASSLPGRRRFWNWVRSQSKPGGEQTWHGVRIEAEWLSHPTLVCPLSLVEGRIVPLPEGGIRWTIDSGFWGNVPVHGEGRFSGSPAEILTVSLDLGRPRADHAAPAPLPGGAWATGNFDAQVSKLGPLRVKSASGQFSLEEGTVRLRDVRAPLARPGLLSGSLDLDLGEAEKVRYELRFQLEDTDLADLTRTMGLEDRFISGSLVAAGVAEGELHPGRHALAHSRGHVSAHARDGEIHRELPAFIAIAVESDTFNPFRSRDTLPYSAIDAEFRLTDGRLVSDSFRVEAPSLRVLAAGETDLIADPKQLEAVVGLFFFRGLDNLISMFPYLDRLLLGPDENFVGAYFAMTGPWDGPEARLIPVKSLTSGPAGFVLEGLPRFVIGGIKRIQSVFTPRFTRRDS